MIYTEGSDKQFNLCSLLAEQFSLSPAAWLTLILISKVLQMHMQQQWDLPRQHFQTQDIPQCFIFNCFFLYFQLLLFCSAASLTMPFCSPLTLEQIAAHRKRNLLILAHSIRSPKCRLSMRQQEVPGFRTAVA